jgi:hypothetical protein
MVKSKHPTPAPAPPSDLLRLEALGDAVKGGPPYGLRVPALLASRKEKGGMSGGGQAGQRHCTWKSGLRRFCNPRTSLLRPAPPPFLPQPPTPAAFPPPSSAVCTARAAAPWGRLPAGPRPTAAAGARRRYPPPRRPFGGGVVPAGMRVRGMVSMALPLSSAMLVPHKQRQARLLTTPPPPTPAPRPAPTPAPTPNPRSLPGG